MKRLLFLIVVLWAVIAVLRIEPARQAIASAGNFTSRAAGFLSRSLDNDDTPRSLPFRPAPPKLAGDGEQCLSRLAKVENLTYKPLDAFSNAKGCGANFPVLVSQIGDTKLAGRGLTLSCPSAERLVKWLDKDVSKVLNKHDKPALTRINHMGSYNCRKIAGSSTWSQHAFANAIDISGFVFEGGESLSIETDWKEAPILEDLANSACGRFNVVLSPAYNASHNDHIHMDLGPYRVCS